MRSEFAARELLSQRADLRIALGMSLWSLLWLLAFAHASPMEGALRVWVGPLAGALLVGFFYGLQRALGTGPLVALWCSALLATASYLTTAATHAPEGVIAALLIAAGFFALHAFRNSGARTGLAVGGLLCGSLALCGAPTRAAAVPLAGYAIYALIARRQDTPLSVSSALLAIPLAATAAWAIASGVPTLAELLGATPSPLAFSQPVYAGLHRFLLSPGAGVLAYTPLLLFGPVAMASCWSGARAEYAAALAIAGVLVLACAGLDPAIESWAAPGPRHLVALSALLLLPLGGWLEATPGRAKWFAVGGLGLVTACAYATLASAPWPAVIEIMGYRDFSNPDDFVFMPHTIPLLGAARLAAEGVGGSWILARSTIAIACFALVVAAGAGLLVRAARRHPDATPPAS